MLKGQDVILLILLRLRNKAGWTYGMLSQAMGISTSQCHLAVRRLQKCKLVSERVDRSWEVSRPNFKEYMIHALKYDFPGETGSVTRGIPTVHRASFADRNFFGNAIPLDDIGEYVWPHAGGIMKGEGLKPIHPCQIKLLQKREQPDLQYNGDIYRFLVCLDLLRIGQTRERKWARERIEEMK